MRLKTIVSTLRTQPGPSAWVWLFSAGLHIGLLSQWSAWPVQAAPSSRWQVQMETMPDPLGAVTPRPAAPTPVQRPPAEALPQAAMSPMARTSPPPASQPSVSLPTPPDPPSAETLTLAAAPLTEETLLAQVKPAATGLAATTAMPAAMSGAIGFRSPTGARLRYDLQGIAKGFGYSAKAELLWQPDASQYEARLEVSHFLLGSRVQSSQGQIAPEGLAPRRFGDKVRSEQAAHFQRDKGLITYSANTPDAPLLTGTQDRLSVFIQISGMLLADPQRWGPGTVLNFNTTGARDSEPWAFQVAGMETLKMPIGTLEALRLVRQEQKQYDQRVELWMSPSLEHLPVRIRITQTSGDQVDLLLRSKEPPHGNP